MRSSLTKLVVCAGMAALAVLAGTPAMAAVTSTPTQPGIVSKQPMAWQYGGEFATQQGCINAGNQMVSRGWATDYDCNPNQAGRWNLWYLPA